MFQSDWQSHNLVHMLSEISFAWLHCRMSISRKDGKKVPASSSWISTILLAAKTVQYANVFFSWPSSLYQKEVTEGHEVLHFIYFHFFIILMRTVGQMGMATMNCFLRQRVEHLKNTTIIFWIFKRPKKPSTIDRKGASAVFKNPGTYRSNR